MPGVVEGDRHCGSSPLTRGKPADREPPADRVGLIPAHAGKTRPPTRGRLRDHGSSPLTRGKRGRRLFRQSRRGLIPAHAGKTVRGARPHFTPEAHPRSRGENTDEELAAGESGGSSPLTRGKLGVRVRGLRQARLIPAHAGKTVVYCLPASAVAAHPRSRGENPLRKRARPRETGSSPLTRGKRRSLMTVICRGRLIPAHAGKTVRSLLTLLISPAHPRSRGENRYRPVQPRDPSGSSPLTRGKRPGMSR